MVIVQKYGGTSVANAERIINAARRIVSAKQVGNNVVVVVSAQGSMTDSLLEKARAVNPAAGKRELDMLLCTGEQQSAALLAMAIQGLGFSAVSLNAVQVGIKSTETYGNALIQNVETARILSEFKKGNIVIVAGFQGVNRREDLTTLGRGASDTTAVALAAVLKADVCEICTDVDGIYTADPRLIANAMKLDSVSYDNMLELTASGLQKPHNRAVKMAKRFGVKILVRSSLTDAQGTWIKEAADVEDVIVSGIVVDRNITRVTVAGLECGAACDIFALLAGAEIDVDTIQQNTDENLSFTVPKHDVKNVKETLGGYNLDVCENLAKLTVVGVGLGLGKINDVLSALKDSEIDIKMITTGEIKISVLVDERAAATAAKTVHDRLFPQRSEDA